MCVLFFRHVFLYDAVFQFGYAVRYAIKTGDDFIFALCRIKFCRHVGGDRADIYDRNDRYGSIYVLLFNGIRPFIPRDGLE